MIDDGSTDRTVEVAREHGVEHIVRLTNNKGLAAAFQAGLDASLKLGADLIVNTDADNQYRGADIPKLLAPILAGEADMVVGDRRVAQIEHFSGAKKALQRLGSWVVRRLSGTEITDTTSGFRAYNREAALQLLVVDNFTYTLESLIQAGKMLVAVDQVEIGTNAKTRESRLFDSTGDYVRRNGLAIGRIYARYEPLRVFATPAAVVAVLALAAWSPFLIDWIFNGDSHGHIQSLILGAVLFIAAVQLFALGVIGDLLAGQRVMTQRVFERVRRVELALGVAPSHYERGGGDAEPSASRPSGSAPRRSSAERKDGRPRGGAVDYGKTAGFLSIGVGLTGAHHLPLLRDRLAHALQARLRPDRGAVVGRLHHRLDALPADRPAPLAPHLRAPGAAASRSASRCASRRRSSSGWRCLRGPRAGPARPDPGRPARGQRDPLLGLLLRGVRLRRQLLRPRLPRRARALRPVLGADPLGVDLPHHLRGAGRRRHPQRPERGGDRDRRRPLPQPARGPVGVRKTGGKAERAARRARPRTGGGAGDAGARSAAAREFSSPTAPASPPRCC